jgi:hypothetical protein
LSPVEIPSVSRNEVNLLEVRPLRNVSWELDDNDQVVLLIPKFRNRLAVKYVLPYLARPHFRIRLDAFGSFVWNRFDGQTPIKEIAASMRANFGESVEPVYERIGKFVQTLEREKFVILDAVGSSHQPCVN